MSIHKNTYIANVRGNCATRRKSVQETLVRPKQSEVVPDEQLCCSKINPEVLLSVLT